MSAPPNDPVIQFILDRNLYSLITQDSYNWPYSRLSYSRASKIGYKLLVLRCAQIGIDPPTRAEAQEWVRA